MGLCLLTVPHRVQQPQPKQGAGLEVQGRSGRTQDALFPGDRGRGPDLEQHEPSPHEDAPGPRPLPKEVPRDWSPTGPRVSTKPAGQ